MLYKNYIHQYKQHNMMSETQLYEKSEP